MTRVRIALACVVVGALAFGSTAHAQRANHSGGLQAVADSGSDAADSADREALAEAIVAREEAAAARAFDPAFRAKARADLASRSVDELAAIQRRGSGLVSASPHTLGANSAADLVFTPVAPCRIINTRLVGGPIAAGTQRSFLAASSNYSSQGGSSTSCGVPFGPTTAVVVNIVAVDAAGAGDLRAFPYGGTVPTASVINYAKVSDEVNPSLVLNVANGLLLKICDPAAPPAGGCTFDLTLQADVSAVQVVADVLGFFRKVDTTTAQYFFTATGIVAGTNYYFPTTTYTAPQNQTCLLNTALAIDLVGGAYSTGTSYPRAAIQNVTAGGTNANFPWGVYLAFNPTNTGMSTSAVATLTAGTTYKFGCFLAAGGNLPNATNFVYCSTSVVCQ